MNQSSNIHLEFIAMMAVIMSLAALATDILLPALGVIGETFGVYDTADKQLLVTMTFLGIGIGQLAAGALSDSFGRKPIMYLGFVIFILASVLSVTTQSYEVLVLSRILQGVGLSAPRTLSTAIIRDSYSGNEMAKIMSFVAMMFIFVPAIAPTLGALILNQSGWRAIFYVQAAVALVGAVWFGLRQAETLPAERRATFNLALFSNSFKAFISQRQSLIYTVALGFAMGAFMSFLSISESILIGQYHKADEFPYLFGSIALAMGASMFINGKNVVKYGMKKMVQVATVLFTLAPLIFIVCFGLWGNPSLWIVMLFLMLQVFSIGFIFGNLTSLALEPLGHIAGMASAIIGFISTVIGVAYAGVIGSLMGTTVLPLFVGFFISGLMLLILIRIAER